MIFRSTALVSNLLPPSTLFAPVFGLLCAHRRFIAQFPVS
jgi:hypothetical protein